MSIASTKWHNEHKHDVSKTRRKKKVYKEKKVILCRVCNELVGVKGISIHLSKLHNIVFIDYVKQHMSDFLEYGWKWCDNCGINPARNFASSKKKFSTCSIECAAKKKSLLYKGRIPWNKGIKMPDEYCEKMSKINSSRPGHLHSEETKRRLSESAKQRAQQPNYINPMQGKTHTSESIAKICKDRIGSKLELLGKKLLDAAGYEYIHQFFIVHNGRSYSYDFKLTGLPIVIELDGDYWHGGPGVKKHFFDVERIKQTDVEKEIAARSREYTLIRVWESELNSSPQILVERIHREINNT